MSLKWFVGIDKPLEYQYFNVIVYAIFTGDYFNI